MEGARDHLWAGEVGAQGQSEGFVLTNIKPPPTSVGGVYVKPLDKNCLREPYLQLTSRFAA